MFEFMSVCFLRFGVDLVRRARPGICFGHKCFVRSVGFGCFGSCRGVFSFLTEC